MQDFSFFVADFTNYPLPVYCRHCYFGKYSIQLQKLTVKDKYDIMKKHKLLAIIAILSLIVVPMSSACESSRNDSSNLDVNAERILWINGTHAVLTLVNGQDVATYGGERPSSALERAQRTSLEQWWGITNKEDLDEMVDDLVLGLHNPRFLEDAEYYGITEMSEEEFNYELQFVDSAEDVFFFQKMHDAYTTYGDNAIMGWDLSRATQLCANGYIAGYYTYDEAIEKSIDICIIIQATFDSWDEFWDSYMLGFAYWSEDESDYNSRMRILESLKQDNDSPLHLDWNLNMQQ